MLQKFEKGTFLLVNVAAQRARQLMQGAPPLIKSSSRKPAAIAIREVREGHIPHYMMDIFASTEDTTAEEMPGEPQEEVEG